MSPIELCQYEENNNIIKNFNNCLKFQIFQKTANRGIHKVLERMCAFTEVCFHVFMFCRYCEIAKNS